MTITQEEFDRWRGVIRLAYQDADTAAQLIRTGEVQRGAERAHGAAETLRQLEMRMNRVWESTMIDSLGLDPVAKSGER